MIERSSRLRIRPDIVHRRLGEGAVILNLETGAYFSLNGVGALVWELLDGDRDVAGIIAGVAGRVEDAPPSLDHDVVEFLERLVERDLVEVVPES